MIFLGCLFRKEEEELINKLSNNGLQNAANTFQWSLLNGLNQMTPINIINVLPVGTYPKNYKKLLLKSNRWVWKECRDNLEVGSVNLPFLKQLSRYKKIKNELNFRIMNNGNCSNVIIYSMYLPFLKAVYKLDRKIQITLIVTDLPEFYDLEKVGGIRKILRKINNYFVYKYLARIDHFVLLTEQMKIPLNIGNRPYCVIEGIVDTQYKNLNSINLLSDLKDRKIILYAGTLHYKFGIKSLLDAFRQINNNKYELWICGSGEAEGEILKLSKIDKRIKYFGFLVKDEVKKLEQQATLLINPRTNEGEYTKYSFPSKTMGYLVSGKPVLMHKLEGIPSEYDKYIYYFEGTQVKDIRSKIIEVLEKKEEERKEFGEAARQFVMNNKNNVVQAQKILKMIIK
ncbi:MAG: glycosyltransferase [Solibacillus sp.]|uniref:glycosyltransferase n=1 Tax=unclassified Solibacillus TaxID=2637870 RepID=UPI0030FADDA1